MRSKKLYRLDVYSSELVATSESRQFVSLASYFSIAATAFSDDSLERFGPGQDTSFVLLFLPFHGIALRITGGPIDPHFGGAR